MPQATRIFPVFAVRDLQEALAYYTNQLSFSIAWRWDDPISRAVVTPGATIVMELGAWGMRNFRVVDPSGDRIGFASPA